MALLNIGDDPWLLEYESCEKLQRDIMEQLMARQREQKSSESYAKISANIRMRLKQFNNEVQQLIEKLDNNIDSRSITYDEIERRSQQIELLKSKGMQMGKMFNEVSGALRDSRNALLGGSNTSWAPEDDEILGANEELTVSRIKEQKERMMKDQEHGLENLANIIARQKNIAETITTEVDLHNDIIDDLGDHMERTDARIANETRNVTVIDRKDTTCIYWVTIILLFISIIIVAFI